MRIGVIGLGYIGSVTAAVLANHGNDVVGIDTVKPKVDAFNSANPPIYEPGLSDLIERNRDSLRFSTSYEDLKDVEVVFIAVPTPNRDGGIDLSYVMSAASSLKQVNPDCLIIIKSTVVPGTARKVIESTGMTVASNPEFTREGSAIADTESPDRVVIGGPESASRIVEGIWIFTGAPMVVTTNENAELIKYASNSFLATKISFINEFANLCEKIPGADVETVARGMGLDQRIGERFLKAGIGYGGSCFPKDTLAILSFARSMGQDLRIVDSAITVNDGRIDHAVDVIIDGNPESLRGRRIAILGVAFKDNTDDVRESQPLKLINSLLGHGAMINVYDPIVRTIIEGTTRFSTVEECIRKSEIVVIATEWPEFRKLDPGLVGDRLVVDVRRILDPSDFPLFRAVGYGNASD